ncbi:hypothetical protein ACFQ36_04685 [Arthrobacter sp. GCM10027362]|uniref:hypothetical protein n=1 Tax=Arthrobacter sp. GCM10027362 TaxID=3273379 RepID=UPI00362B82F4
MTESPLESWDLLPGTLVEIRRSGRAVRTGRVDAVTVNADVLWLSANGSHPRRLFEKAEGYEVWPRRRTEPSAGGGQPLA